MHIFGQLMHIIFGELMHIFGLLVHIFARKLLIINFHNFETSFEKFGAIMATKGLQWY